MKLTRIHLKNFKLFHDLSLSLHPQFNLLIGENGAGKTSLLEALAIVCGVWLYEVPDPEIANSRVPLRDDHINLQAQQKGDRVQFVPALNCIVSAWGEVFPGVKQQWTQEILFGKKSKVHLKEARKTIADKINAVASGDDIVLPVIAYYGAGRAWLPHNERKGLVRKQGGRKSRWEAFYDCLNERIRISDLQRWFADEAIERGNRGGKYRPGFDVVKRAILRCIPGATDAWYDSDRSDIAISIGNKPQPFSNISAGQRTMLALVADIAIKCVIQNNHLVPPESLEPQDEPIPRVLRDTPGVVLIDEIDVHLHPNWQRRVINDLRTTFPRIQFVATTHAPQVVGEIEADCVRVLSRDGTIKCPNQTFGLDSNWILEHLMSSDKVNREVGNLIQSIEFDLLEFNFEQAEDTLRRLRSTIGETPEVTRLEVGVQRAKDLTAPEANEEIEPEVNKEEDRYFRSTDASDTDEHLKMEDGDTGGAQNDEAH